MDTSFWKATYDAHAGSLLAFLTRRVARREEAEDLLQETFVRAIRAGVREGGSVRSYLFTIAHHLMVNRVRRKRPLLVSELEGPPDLIDAVADSGAATDWAALAGDLSRRLAALRATLAPAHRLAFDLGILERRPYREIAEVTGWTLAQVKINVYRARRRAMAAFADFLPEVET